jgi:hypothetical protein
MIHARDETVCRRRHASLTPRIAMNARTQVRVTLSDDLLNHLRQTAQQKHVPLRWLGAGLVRDTLETGLEPSVGHLR